MRRAQPIGLFVLVSSFAVIGTLLACVPTPKTPASVGGSAGSSAPSTMPTDAPTTTTALGNNGDLQGAKLSSSSHKEIETKGDGGAPKPVLGKSDEPGRNRDDIRAIILSHRDEARACYDSGLNDHPGMAGDLFINFLIDPTGAVTDVSVDHSKSSIHEETVGTCVSGVVKKITFNPSVKGFETRASYPFNFHPHAGGKK